MSIPHTDIPSGDWIDRFLPAAGRPYARLMRLDRPVGTWLLLLPCWWGVALAGIEGPREILFLLLFALGATVMRGAGCVINDLWDRELDRKVERTRTRPLASGALKARQALACLLVLLGIGLAVLLQFNRATILAAFGAMPLVILYPLAKRVTWWPQFVLGLTFNWGAGLGWLAVRGHLAWPPVLLYIAGVFWTLGYDTIYAHQDERDDALAGVKSSALYLGAASRPWIGFFFAMTLLLAAGAALAAGMKIFFWPFWAVAALQAFWQAATFRREDPANCLRRFRSNRDFGLLLFLAFLAGRF